jgi:peptidoglycan/LPS O-acetylase OafA/YrhL
VNDLGKKNAACDVEASPWLLDDEHRRRIVDGLRALGIVLVVAFHGAFLFTKILPPDKLDGFISKLPSVLNVVWQALGSEVVFFSSGFLLSYLLVREHDRFGSIDVRDFWVRRFSRIVPLFLVALGVFMIGRSFHLDRFVWNALFLSRIAGHFELTPHAGKNYVPVGWSLEVMVQVYALLPFLVWGVLKTRRPLAVASVLVIASVVPRWFALDADPAAYTTPYHELVHGGEAPELQKDLYYLTWYRLTPFLLGLVAALVVTRHRAPLMRWCASNTRATTTLLVGALMVVASGFLPLHSRTGFVHEFFGPQHWHWFWTLQRAVLITGVALVLFALLGASRGLPAFVARGFAWRGFAPISHGIYSIYLFHFVCLVPAMLIVFLPAVIEGVASAPSLDRKVVVEHARQAIDSASLWQYLLMVALAVWLSTKLAKFLTRVVEKPVQDWLRVRYTRRERVLLPQSRASGARDASAAANGAPTARPLPSRSEAEHAVPPRHD